jgi:hypothetical protein
VKPIHVILAAVFGAVAGLLVSGLWWTVQDSRYTCLGGCSPADKGLPAGDITLMVGALGGVLIAIVLLLSRALRGRSHR